MSTGHALRALILITCDGRKGEWVSLGALAERLGVSPHHVQAAATELTEANQVQHAVAGGTPYWGVGVEGVQP